MENDFDLQQDPMPQQQPQNPPFSLPPYPQIIMEAIEASTDSSGCNKMAISKHIESTQTTLPPSHSTLLNYHLNQMKQSGEIVLVKNNFMKPNPNAPPKRGRGRPPKPKSEVDSSHVAAAPASPTRPRGRPPKSKDSQTEPSSVQAIPKASSVSERPRGRGRPPKKAKTESETVKAAEAPTAQPNGERRGRGRPPKVKPVMVPVGC